MKIQRYKPRIWQQLLIFLIAVAVSITALPPTYIVYADNGYNGGQGTDGSIPTTELVGGPSAAKTGIIFYIVDKESGVPQTNIGFVTPDASATSITSRFVQSKLGQLNFTSHMIATDLPKPVTWNGSNWSPNGNAVKAWLLADGSTMKRWEFIVKNLFGDAALQQIQADQGEYSIVVEPVAWMNIYFGNHGWYLSESRFAPTLATATGWAEYYAMINQPTGDNYTQKMTHQALPYSMVLEETRFGLSPHDGEAMQRIDSARIMNEGYGIHIIDLEDETIHTYWEPNGSPGYEEPADPPKDGTCNMVKCYYELNLTTGEKTIVGSPQYVVKDCTNNISIDDEPGFELEKWAISGTSNFGITALDFNPPSPSRVGTESTEVKLSDLERTVYVLLRRTVEDEEDLDYNYKLTESSITRRIKFSTPDHTLSMSLIQNHTFQFANPAHQTTCGGHTYYTACAGHSHSTTCDEDCTSSHNCGKDCVENTAYCTWGKWTDQKLTLSILNTQLNSYPDILATKGGWSHETKKGSITKRVLEKTRTKVGASYYKTKNWDYVCVIHRGKDKLTLADWINSGSGVPASNSANTDLSDTSL